MTEASETAEARKTCPSCGHENIPRAAFCARCGRSLNGEQPETDDTPAGDDTETTTAYVPIGSSNSHGASSPWAPPSDATVIDVDPGQTTAFPVGKPMTYTEETPEYTAVPEAPRHEESIRGLVLGIVASLLIAAVLALYVYSAWLDDSMRDTVDGWLPWVV